MAKWKKCVTTLIIIGLLIVEAWALIFSINSNLSPVLYIAHRGHGYFDNTAEAFYNSTEYWGIECDVRITDDGKFILNHDAEVQFDDGSIVNVEASTYSSLIDGRLPGGYALCSFAKYLDICNELDKVAVVELKSDLTDAEVTMLLDEIEEYHSINKSMIISFSQSNLLKVKAQANIKLQYLFSNNKEYAMDFCIKNKIDPSINYGEISKEDVKIAHANNLKIGVWTVNLMGANITMKNYGVDYITSDYFSC